MEKFLGVWDFVDCENFDEYLKGKLKSSILLGENWSILNLD
jgi:hypothetical protein